MFKFKLPENSRQGVIRLLKIGIQLIILLVCVYQTITIFDTYLVTFTSRIWRNRTLNATGRSAVFLLGGTGAEFMNFIAAHTPLDKSVVVAERSANFASQNILQYFLIPRVIVTCDCDNLGGKCIPCLNSADSYVPVTKNFPPPDGVSPAKRFIPFVSSSGKSSDYYLGIFVPNEVGQLPPPIETSWNFPTVVKSLGIDLLVLAGLSLLGYFLARLLFSSLSLIDAISLSIPIGAASLTWCVFLSSWAGLPVTLGNILIVYAILVISILALLRLYRKLPISPLKFLNPSGLWKQLRQLDVLSIASIIGVLGVFTLAVFISVGRSYSLYDDIANWSLKGYAIAYEKTIFAGASWGGHGLAYPLSLPLSITIFKLASGDVLPGSKFLIPIYTAALLWGIFRFLHRRGVKKIIAYLGVLLLFTLPQFFFYSTVGYANIPFTACLVLGILWGLDGLRDGNKERLQLSGLLFGCAGWMRPEGIVFTGILIIFMCVAYLLQAGKKNFPAILWLLPGLLIPLVWLVFAHNYIQQDQAGNALKAFLSQLVNGQINIGPILMTARYGIKSFLNPLMWGLLLPVSIVILVLGLPRLLKGAFKPAFPVILMTLLTYIIPVGLFWTEAANESNFTTFLSTSFDRAYLPAAVMTVLLAFYIMFSQKEP